MHLATLRRLNITNHHSTRPMKSTPTSTLTAEQLQPFCSNDPHRFMLHAPFTRGEWTYATNGKIAIRVPKIEGVPEGEVGAEKVFPVSPRGVECLVPSDLPEDTKLECTDCKGLGRTLKCSKCNGSGVFECDECGHVADCKICNGVGSIPSSQLEHPACDVCDGLGHCFKPVSVQVGSARFFSNHLRLIAGLPELKILVNPTEGESSFFHFSGGEGVILPVSQ